MAYNIIYLFILVFLKNSKDIYDKLVGTYEVNNLNHILYLKNQLKEMNMNKGEFMQSYIMRVSILSDQLEFVGKKMLGAGSPKGSFGAKSPCLSQFL